MTGLVSSWGTTQKEVVHASSLSLAAVPVSFVHAFPSFLRVSSPAVTSVFFVQPLFLSVLVLQDGLWSETTLLATQAMSAATLTLTLSKPMFLYLRKL
jgi:hypothetical protein